MFASVLRDLEKKTVMNTSVLFYMEGAQILQRLFTVKSL